MVAKKLLIVFLSIALFSPALKVRAQSCTTLGQTPATAFPVCGSSIFKQDSVPACVNSIVPAPCPNDGNVYEDLNPYWYKFTCFTSGTLALTIKPNNQEDDYDWQLFDITGHNPSDVYSNSSLIVGCNWSGLTGTTGTSAGASSLTECGSTTRNPTGPPIFSKLPQLIQGHNYLLLISHFTGDKQSGYALSFSGGTASITDTTTPALKGVQPICDGSRIQVYLNKGVTCNSLAADGSDFIINGPSSVVGASSNSCSTGFDLDTLILTLTGPLTPGATYTVAMKNGTDQNTLLDNCDNSIPAGESLSFKQLAPFPTPLDSIVPPGCAPDVLRLVFKKEIQCSSIAADGSDFTISGPYPVTVTGASGLNCDANGETFTILVKLSAPMPTAGNFQIRLASGNDGNTIIDECGLTSLASSLPFTILADTVSAAFTDKVLYGCKNDTIDFDFPGNHGVNSWRWSFGGPDSSQVQNPEVIFPVGDSAYMKTVQLIVSNGVCSDTATAAVALDNGMDPKFEAPNIICPKDYAQILNNSTGNISGWEWQFGDGASSSFQMPPDHLYPLTGIETKYNVLLIVTNNLGCSDTAAQQIDVLRSCYIAVPSAFTPNGDGLNDYLYPLNAFKADNLVFRVYNRYGQMVFQTNDWTKKWDGTINGQPQPAGTFVWMLQYTDRDSGRKFFTKGTSILIR